jgi:hypothetical protein
MLQGKIEFRLSLNDASSDSVNSRKRKRGLSTTPSEKPEQPSGFFFHPDDASLDRLNPTYSEYLLSVSSDLSRYLSEAVSYQLNVLIWNFSLVPVAESVALIEVYPNGLKLVQHRPSCPSGEVWRLSHLRRRELVEETEMKVSKERFNLSGVVDAISPIISLDPSNPFCMMELCDEGNKDLTCVVAFFGDKSLAWQPSIQPGERIQLDGLRRKKWQVPESFESDQLQHLTKRAPRFVFLFSATSMIFWLPSIQGSGTFAHATPLPLATLKGTIVAVKTKSVKKGFISARIIEHVDIESDVETCSASPRPVHRLFLAHFPMSTDLQLSLRSGAIIHAGNIHPLGLSTSWTLSSGMHIFGACLRSTVLLLSPALRQEHVPVKPPSLHNVVPHRLVKYSASYREMIFKKYVSRWLQDHFDEDTGADVARLPSPDDLLFLSPSASSKKKNPYAEFFDHAMATETPILQNEDACGCCNSREEGRNRSLPPVIGLNDLRVIVMQLLGKRFRSRISKDSSVVKGWSASIHLSAREIINEVSGTQATGDLLVVGGFASVCVSSQHVLMLSDRMCQLSIRFRDPMKARNGDFITGWVDSVVVSCFCFLAQANEIGSSQNCGSDDSVILQSLPPLNDSLFDNTMGGGALLRLGKYTLVASVQLWCNGQHLVSKNDRISQDQNAVPTALRLCSLTECLSVPKSINGRIQGAVIRSRFRLAKTCLVLTVADFEFDQGCISPSHLQTLDVEVSVPIHPSQMAAFKRVVSEIKSEDMTILEDECVLGASWWTVAERCYSAPLVAGGWDEYCGEYCDRHLSVTVSLPAARLSIARRGYIRYSTTVDSLQAELGDLSGSKASPIIQPRRDFDFVVGGRFFDGMLCRRPLRRKLYHDPARCLGELWNAESWRGCTDTIAGLFEIACRTIESADPCAMSPSLVRRVTGAQFLGVIFCSATCKCIRCFKTLVNIKPRSKIDEKEQRSFWHNPAPDGPADINLQSVDHLSASSSEPFSRHIHDSSLRCPSDCPLKYLSIQWECSGVLDDGTGQAKLYADREAALTLLGFESEELDQIEKAMWSSRCPEIRYQKSIPPRKELREQIQLALAKRRDCHRSPIDLLPPTFKAEYLVHQHCRLSMKPRRALDYFVRCKPLSDVVSHLNHDTIDTYLSSDGGKNLKVSGQASSYKLPPIKLELVDCGVPWDTTTSV